MNYTKVVYTALFGNYDRLTQIPPSADDICYVCFTDQKISDTKGWTVILVDSETSNLSKAMLNRYYKINPHLFFSDYDSSLYIDANIELLQDPSFLFEQYLKKNDIAVPKHFARNCIFSEATECIIVGKDKRTKIQKQMKKYKLQGMPENYGLGENNIILRNHNSATIITIMEDWWNEMNMESGRDQLSFGYVLWKNKINFTYMDESARAGKNFFRYHMHSNALKSSGLSNIIYKLMVKYRIMKYSNIKY